MVVYISALIISLLFAILSMKQKGYNYNIKFSKSGKVLSINKSNIFAFISFLPIMLVSGLRYMVGVDYNSYLWLFQDIKEKKGVYIEGGYLKLNQIIIKLTNNPQALFFVTSVIIIGLVFIGIYAYSQNPALSIFLFFTMGYLFSSFNILRQYIAVAVLFAGLKFIKENKLLPYLVLVLIAFFFHKTAVIMLPLFFLTRIRWKQSYMLIISMIAACFIPLRGILTNILVLTFYPQYAGTSLIKPLSIPELAYYGLTFGILVLLCLAYKYDFFNDTTNLILFNCIFYTFLMYLCLSFVPEINRIALYIELYVIILIPRLFAAEKNKNVRRLYYIIAIIAFTIFFFISVGAMGRYGVLPYQTIFSK